MKQLEANREQWNSYVNDQQLLDEVYLNPKP